MAVTWRIDKFVVPEDVRDEFWTNVQRTHAVLRDQPGFLDDALLEKASGPSQFNVVTVVRWSSGDDIAAARTAVERAHQTAGFRPAEFFENAGIKADLGNYVDTDR